VSLFDAIRSVAEKHPETNEEQHSNLVRTAIQMFGNQNGVSELINNAQSQGLGHVVQSWVSTGANQAVAPGQVQSLVGQDRINQFASRIGIPPAIASAALARILPLVVDKFTPEGKLPQAA
jgi:uncharacterized protein YidB (DUF937 family)